MRLQESVSVVIATRTRSDLIGRALDSVFAQTHRPLEVVVAVDGVPGDELSAVLKRHAVKVVQTCTPVGGAQIRNIGVSAAKGDWVGLLDDDDQWLPSKLQLQLELARNTPSRYPVISCRVFADDGNQRIVRPSRLPGPSEKISDYVLSIAMLNGRGMLQTSTLLVPRKLLTDVPFRNGLRIHQDWDWVIRAARCPGVEFLMTPQPGIVYDMDPARATISKVHKGAAWNDSLAWIRSMRPYVTRRAYSYFIATQVVPGARAAAAPEGIAEALKDFVAAGGCFRPLAGAIFLSNLLLPFSVRHRLRTAYNKSVQPGPSSP